MNMVKLCLVDSDSFRYLSHHGIKGQKRGIRRYQNFDGSLTFAGKNHYRSTNKNVKSIISSMSKNDLEKLNLYDEYNSDNLINRQLKKIGKTPVSFVDISNEDGYMNVTVGTRHGSKYRGKGYANECVKKAVDWWDSNKSRYVDKKLSWWVLRDNIGSIKLAENNGFKLNKKDSDNYPNWYHYEY